MEHGFFHPSRGYWQTIGKPTEKYLRSYPEGTIEVPVRPSALHEWVDGRWVEGPPPAVQPEEVKAEAARRIVALMPEYKQRNFLALHAEMSMAYGSRIADWPADMQQLATDGLAVWAKIKTLRLKSDALEAMNPIPTDFDADKWWT